MTIFVSVAAYRDPELAPTLADCLAKARWPADLRFGICWQHGEGEERPAALPGQSRRIDVPWRNSRGACWARAEIMTLYDGEDWFLQLDSHHRFVEGWDALLINQAERSGAAKPLLTTYAPAYDPATSLSPAAATVMRLDRFSEDGIPLFTGGAIPVPRADGGPVRARFVSAHLLFAPGSFVADVPYDPDLYFIGEEISLAVRAFTHGYALFHPGATVVWHEYTRRLRTKHWDDHLPGRGVAIAWHDRDAASLAKVRRLLAGEDVGAFGCGGDYSLTDYQAYASVDFRRRFASRAAKSGTEPPLPGGNILCDWAVRLTVDPATLPAAALDDPQFWYVGFHDADGAEIARDDATRPELRRLLAAKPAAIIIERRFASARRPASWTLWPTDRRGRWLDRIDHPLDAASLTGRA